MIDKQTRYELEQIAARYKEMERPHKPEMHFWCAVFSAIGLFMVITAIAHYAS